MSGYSSALRWVTIFVLAAAAMGKLFGGLRSSDGFDAVSLIVLALEFAVVTALLLRRWRRFGAAGAGLIGIGGVVHAMMFNKRGCRCFGDVATLDRGDELIVASLLAAAGLWLLSTPQATSETASPS
jgi:hypothetical protein